MMKVKCLRQEKHSLAGCERERILEYKVRCQGMAFFFQLKMLNNYKELFVITIPSPVITQFFPLISEYE